MASVGDDFSDRVAPVALAASIEEEGGIDLAIATDATDPAQDADRGGAGGA